MNLLTRLLGLDRILGKPAPIPGATIASPIPAFVKNAFGAEPTFTLDGSDPIASGLVRDWCDAAKAAGVNAEKVLGARAIADRMDGGTGSFTLRGQDQLAPAIVLAWCARRRARKEPVADAEQIVEAMRAWQPKKLPD